MDLCKIIISETHDEQIIVLREPEGGREFPIMIGIWEAAAIDRNVKQAKTPRPMTHDLLESVIRGLNGSLERIIVSDLKDRTFYAKIVLRRNGESVEIDSRPSDAIALAVQMRAPIYVEERVLEGLTPQGPDFSPPPEYDPTQEEKDEGDEEEVS